MANKKEAFPKAQWAQLKIQRDSDLGWGRNMAIMGWIKAVMRQIRPKTGWGLTLILSQANGAFPCSEMMTINPKSSFCKVFFLYEEWEWG